MSMLSHRVPRLGIAALATLFLAGPSPRAWGICDTISGGAPIVDNDGGPGNTGPTGDTGPIGYPVGDFATWWKINRDDLLLTLKPQREEQKDDLEDYVRKTKTPPPDKLETLLCLVGYEGDFCSIVKEVGVRRLRKFPKVREELTAILKDPKAPTCRRAWAAYALGDLKVRKAIPDLVGALKEKDIDLRGFSVVSLGKMETPEAYEAILPMAKNAEEAENIRILASLSLGASDLPAAREALAAIAAKDASLPVRRAAILAIGVHAKPEERKLLEGLCRDSETPVRQAAVLALGLAGGDTTLLQERLTPSKESDGAVRAHAALALGISPSPKAVEELTRCLQKDADFNAKGCAALALGHLRDPKSVEPLTQALKSKSYGFVSNYAAIGLGLTGKKEAAAPLAENLQAKQFDRITSCAAGLAILGFPEASKPLLKALENRNHPIAREYAEVALGRLKVPDTLPRLMDCMKDPDVVPRHAAAMALGIFGDPAACPVLQKALTDKQEIVRNLSSLSFDLLTDDETKPLTLGDRFKADPRNEAGRHVGPKEINRLLNRYLPADYKLPVSITPSGSNRVGVRAGTDAFGRPGIGSVDGAGNIIGAPDQ